MEKKSTVTNEMLGDAFIAMGRRIKAGRCEIPQEKVDSVYGEIQDLLFIPVSKETACGLLGISRSTFDARVREGSLPKGQHRRGFKELVWNKNELV